MSDDDYMTATGIETTFAQIPYKRWTVTDCGNLGEGCQHNVGPAYFR